MEPSNTYHYPLLSKKTEVGDGREFPTNPFFNGLANLVREMVYARTNKYDGGVVPKELERYTGKPWGDLLEACNSHLEAHKKGISGSPYVLALIHPAYSFLSHWREVKATKRTKQALAYLRRWIRTLDILSNDARWDILFIETPEHYAAFTSTLVEKGKASDVFFTRFDRGAILQPESYRQFQGKLVYVGGAYTHACLKTGIEEMGETLSPRQLRLLPELTMVRGCYPPAPLIKAAHPKLARFKDVQKDEEWHSELEVLVGKVKGTVPLNILLSAI